MGEQARLWEKGTENLEAYTKFFQARGYFQRFTVEGNALARQLSEEIIALDPSWARAYVSGAWVHLMDILFGSSKSPRKSREQAEELAQKALTLDPSLAITHGGVGLYLFDEKAS